jgi:hypothetical protein
MNRITRLLTPIFLLFSWTVLNAQNGTLKGQVLDKQSEAPLLGATVELLDTPNATGVITDEDGRFVLEDVPVGRRIIRISFIGYETLSLPNIEVTSGKDVFLTVRLLESLNQLNEVVVTNEAQQDKALNKLAVVSARQFGIEEVSRFSGGRGDVGRLAANFAGVSAPDDSRNDIVVRGNSPTGLLWRLEGIPIPSPNHYSTLGTTGGPVSALNPNMLKNSDFITSAFPAEYGNAIGGVFDLGFRNGNADRYEFNLQTGIFTGIEALAEGPLGDRNGSFLVAARYSLVGLLGVGAGGTAATPNYSDISFNINLGNKSWGSLSTFGIIASSDIEFLGDDIDPDDLFAAEDENTFVDSRFGVVGFKHRLPLGKSSYLRTIVSGSFQNNDFRADRFIDKDSPQERVLLYTDAKNREERFTFSTLFNSKWSPRFTLRSGVLIEQFQIESFLADRNEQADNNGDGDPDLFVFRDIDESLRIVQPYIQGQYRLNSAITLNAGIHSQYTSVNEQWVYEPRAALNIRLSERQSLNLGYGVHHQPVPLPLLFLNEEVGSQIVQTNRGLDQVRSDHYVLGYDLKLSPVWRAKLEAYYQDISGAAVESFPSSYSSLTEGADFVFENDRVSLVNEGTGYNQGIELTLERFFQNGFYALLTSSVFESKYAGSDQVERNTPFNNGYVINFLTGREFPIGKDSQHLAFIDTRLSTSGGRYFTPVNLEASQQAGFEIRQEDEAFSLQYDRYFRWDVKFGVKFNSRKKKQSHRLYFDLQNVTARENVFVQRYNRLTNQVDQVNQIGFFPDFGYAFQF